MLFFFGQRGAALAHCRLGLVSSSWRGCACASNSANTSPGGCLGGCWSSIFRLRWGQWWPPVAGARAKPASGKWRRCPAARRRRPRPDLGPESPHPVPGWAGAGSELKAGPAVPRAQFCASKAPYLTIEHARYRSWPACRPRPSFLGQWTCQATGGVGSDRIRPLEPSPAAQGQQRQPVDQQAG